MKFPQSPVALTLLTSMAAFFTSCREEPGNRPERPEADTQTPITGTSDGSVVQPSNAGPAEEVTPFSAPILTSPEGDGWTVTQDGIECTHPPVEADCSDGWCRIPPGCFLMGSPEDEWGRGLDGEELAAVTLTHGFSIRQTEITQTEWLMVADVNPAGEKDFGRDCMDPTCPVGNVTWFEALAYTNALSERAGLDSCYELTGCSGALGTGMTCDGVNLTSPTVQQCPGYRLPTQAEWQYAARAGTRTACQC